VAAMVELWPLQIAAGVAVAVIFRLALIETVTVAVPVQPAAVVPVTVYVVAVTGLTVIGFVFSEVLQL